MNARLAGDEEESFPPEVPPCGDSTQHAAIHATNLPDPGGAPGPTLEM